MDAKSNGSVILISSCPQLKTAVYDYISSLDTGLDIVMAANAESFNYLIEKYKTAMVLAGMEIGKSDIIKSISTLTRYDKELPFVIITEKEHQEKAAALIDKGAEDYVTTDNLTRLGAVIRRELKTYNEVMAAKKARREIKELTNIIDSAEDEIYIIGGDSYKVKFANKKALTNLGYSISELCGMHIEDIAEELIPFEERDWEGGGRISFFTKFSRKDGSKYPAEAVFQSAETEGQSAILAIVHDSTEKEQVKKQAFVLNTAIDASMSAMTVIDEQFKIVYLNRVQANLIGKTRSEIIGTRITDEELYANSGMEFINALQKCKTGESWVGEYQKTGHNGEEYISLGSVSPVLADGVNVTNIVIVEEDITERVKIKSQLLHAQKMETVGELTSGIAHDFTNMLTAIGGFSSIMKRKMDKESRFYTYAEKISELTVRAKGLTKNLLTFSRKQVQAERVLSVNALVSAVGEFLSMVIGSRIELKIELMDEDVNIVGDPVQLEQVIINLATNARDAIDADGELLITTDRSMVSNEEALGGFMEYAVISVRDNGCGISAEKQEKIFEPFFTTKKEGKGTGLGLYIVTDIISRHNGMIECDSAVGQGTEFKIKIPATEMAVEKTLEEQDIEHEAESRTILLVEDEKIVRESLAHALGVYGYEIIEAVNGKEALEIYKERYKEIDMMITDIVMPVMNGISAYNEMKKINPDLKSVFTTGYLGEAHRKEGFNEEEHTVMIKPLLIKELVNSIENILK